MRLFAFISLWIPLVALADSEPKATRLNNKCTTYSMCTQQSVVNECVDIYDGDEIVLEVGRFAHYTFYSTTSTASSYSCDIITNKVGYDASVSGSTQTDQVNTASITDEAPVYTMAVLLHRLWINCSELPDGVVNIDVDVCAME